MIKLILTVLLVITIPIPQWAQSEYNRTDTVRISAWRGSMTTSLVVKDSALYQFQHSAPLFFEDTVWCGGKVVAWGGTVILEVHPDGALWYMPSAF